MVSAVWSVSGCVGADVGSVISCGFRGKAKEDRKGTEYGNDGKFVE